MLAQDNRSQRHEVDVVYSKHGFSTVGLCWLSQSVCLGAPYSVVQPSLCACVEDTKALIACELLYCVAVLCCSVLCCSCRVHQENLVTQHGVALRGLKVRWLKL